MQLINRAEENLNALGEEYTGMVNVPIWKAGMQSRANDDTPRFITARE